MSDPDPVVAGAGSVDSGPAEACKRFVNGFEGRVGSGESKTVQMILEICRAMAHLIVNKA
ncbi:hypothetical protein [Paracoccus nototheniae]|uniref:Uncharacterized protein n=1 Tax=Paracoccus nototheniae TaxID=2489002 RepID=A0ABW4DXL3_9RHOB|nr:hypothetical protein [Paracoccus nototheniae]